MKLLICYSMLLFTVTTTALASHRIEPDNRNVYVGIFGGYGSSNNINAYQYGTVFLTEAAGGPLAVNAIGRLSDESAPFFGVQIGYQTQDIFFSSSHWAIAPTAELEGYVMNKRTFSGTLTNDTARLSESNFIASYPQNRSIYLANAVLNFNNQRFAIQPYVGFGIGSAIVKISGANALNPAESGINHYNANTYDSSSTFAGQIKLGLGYRLNKHVSLFAEYRWLYIASTRFVFGSAIAATHAETSSWQVKLNAQKYNLGNIGIRFNL